MSLPARLRSILSCLTLLALCGTAPAARAAPAGPAMEKAVDDYLAPLLRTNNFAGVILVAKGDEILFAKGYGGADIEQGVPNRPETKFHIASVSKPFTAAAIMLLAERGRIDLHAPLSRILPDYPGGDKLTVHHLLSHMSGIPNVNDFPEYDEIQRRPHSPEGLVALFRDKPLRFTPGERYDYSNSNYNLLAHIVERVSGMAFGEYLRREIFAPLGMTGTGHPAGMGEIVPGLADGYEPEGSTGLARAHYLDWSVKTGNGSLYSTAGDLVKFFDGLHRGRLLNPASLAASFTPYSPNVGYGWFLTKANGRDIHHINGRSPGWSAQADHYVADGVTVIALSNTYSSVTTPIARAVGAIYFGEPFEPMPELKAARLSSAEIARLLGAYQFGPDYYVPNAIITIAERNGDVEARYSTGYPASAFIPLGGARFLMRPFWIEAEFVVGTDGKASALRIDRFSGTRIK